MKRWFFLGFLGATLVLAQPAPLPAVAASQDVWIELEGGCDRVLEPGDPVSFVVGVSEPAYLYVFDVRSADAFVRLVPGGDGAVRRAGPNEVLRFPGPGAGVRFQAAGPPGEGYLYLLATRVPLALGSVVSAAELERVLNGLDPASRRVAWCRYVVEGATAMRATLRVETDPAGLEVYLDDVRSGTSPLTVSLEPGLHRLRVEGPGVSQEQTLRLAEGDRITLRLRLPAPKPAGVVGFAVASTPQGAWVHLDGRYACNTPCTVEARPGVHALRLELPGYQVWGGYVRIGEGAEPGTSVLLERADAVLEVRTDVAAALFLDGMPLGWTRPGAPRTFAVAPGWHEVIALAPGYEAARDRLLILREDREEVELELDEL